MTCYKGLKIENKLIPLIAASSMYVLSLMNSRLGDYLYLVNPNELGVKETTDTQKFSSLPRPSSWYRQQMKIKIKTLRQTWWLHFSNSHLPCHKKHHQRIEFTFNNSYAIVRLVPCTVYFRTEVSCWRESYSSKATLLLSWSHRYKIHCHHHEQVDCY